MARAIAVSPTRAGSNRTRASPGSRLTTTWATPSSAPMADSTLETHPAQCIPLIAKVRGSVLMAERGGGSVAPARVGGPFLLLARLRLSLLRLGAVAMAAPAPHPEPVHGEEHASEQDPDPVAPDELFHRVPPGALGTGAAMGKQSKSGARGEKAKNRQQIGGFDGRETLRLPEDSTE